MQQYHDYRSTQKEQKKGFSGKICVICKDSLSGDEIEVTILSKCECVFHDDCLRGHIGAELDKSNLEIKCPMSVLRESSK
jgi:hypothetical protein